MDIKGLLVLSKNLTAFSVFEKDIGCTGTEIIGFTVLIRLRLFVLFIAGLWDMFGGD